MCFYLTESFRSASLDNRRSRCVDIFLSRVAAEDFLQCRQGSSCGSIIALEPVQFLARLLQLESRGVKLFRVFGVDGTADFETSKMVFHDPRRAFEQACCELAKLHDATLAAT
jgi:hypothetical protein